MNERSERKRRLRPIECRGSYYQIGFSYGFGLGRSIKWSLEKGIAGITERYPVSREEILAQARKFLPAVSGFDPDLLEILRGQADGSGLSFEEVFALRCMLELGLYYDQLSLLCTSFALTGEATAGGRTILGQNVDWSPGTTVDLLHVRYPTGIEHLVVVVGGAGEYVLSSQGFGMCSNLTCSPPGTGRFQALPIGCYLPRVMRQETAGDAFHVLSKAARGIAYCHIADENGFVRGLESQFTGTSVIEPTRGVLAHSNHYLTRRFHKNDLGILILPDTDYRLHRIRDLIGERYGEITPEMMMEVLSDHEGFPKSICRHPDGAKPAEVRAETLVSFIMIPGDRTMFVCPGQPCENGYEEYRI